MTSKVKSRRPQGPNRKTRRELGSWLSQVEEALTKRLDGLDRALKVLGGSVKTIWDNQKELAKSEELLDEQFAVSTRMTIVAVNHILERMGHGDDKITEKDVEKLFKDWALFRKRPDYRNFMMEWFLGADIDKLPPPPQQAKEGGSDAESDHRNQDVGEVAKDSGTGQEDDVSEVQTKDSAEAQP